MFRPKETAGRAKFETQKFLVLSVCLQAITPLQNNLKLGNID